MLTIDLGLHSTKAAILESREGKPRLMRFGRDDGANLPTRMYIPPQGSILIGEDAELQSLRDPSGAAHNVLRSIDARSIKLRNGRVLRSVDLVAAIFSHIKSQADFSGDVQLTFKPSTESESTEAVVSAAKGAGFSNIECRNSLEAIAHFGVSENGLGQSVVAIADCGASAIDIGIVEKRKGKIRQRMQSDQIIGPGVDEIDGRIWDKIRPGLCEGQLIRQEIIDIRRQLRHIKEAFSRYQREVELLSLATSAVEVPRSIIIRVLEEFYDEAFGSIGALWDALQRENLGDVPLLLAGGGAHLFGIEQSILLRGWSGPIIRLRQPEYAAVLGAAQAIMVSSSRSCPECGTQQLLSKDACSTCGFPFHKFATGTASLSSPRSESISAKTCPEPECGYANDPARTYCERCGCPF